MKSEKVICYGASSGFERLYYAINALYDVVAVSDKNPEKKLIAEKYNINYMLPEQLKEAEFDYIVITSCYEKAITEFLVNELGIQDSKVIGYSQFLSQQKVSLGTENEDKDIYILRRMDTSNGLNILLLEYMYQLMHCKDLEKYNVVIDAKNYTSIYHSEDNKGKQNILEYYCDIIDDISIDSAYKSKNVTLSAAAMLNKNVEKITKMQRDICKDSQVREQYRGLYNKYFHINNEIKAAVKEQVEKYIEPIHKQGKKICAVVDRSREYNYTKTYAHHIFPDEEFTLNKLSELKKIWGFDYILLDTHNIKTENWWREKFGDIVILTERTRIDVDLAIKNKLTGGISSQRNNDKYYQGKELLVSRYLLAECDYFYSGICGSSAFPMLIGDKFIDTYIYENGRFGFEYEAVSGIPIEG